MTQRRSGERDAFGGCGRAQWYGDTSIVQNRAPVIDVYESLAYTAPGFIAHQSALKGGTQLPVPQFDR